MLGGCDGAEYFASPTGTATDNCTETNPCFISTACSRATSEGDIVTLLDGDYYIDQNSGVDDGFGNQRQLFYLTTVSVTIRAANHGSVAIYDQRSGNDARSLFYGVNLVSGNSIRLEGVWVFAPCTTTAPRVIDLLSGVSFTIFNSTVTGTGVVTCTGPVYGYVRAVSAASVVLEDSTFYGSSWAALLKGGVVQSTGTDVTVLGCYVYNFKLGGAAEGAAIYALGAATVHLNDSTFESGDGSLGGAVATVSSGSSQPTLVISGSKFLKNKIQRTGGGSVYTSNARFVVIENSEFSEAALDAGVGGALYLVGTSSLDSEVTIRGCSFYQLSSLSHGGAMYVINVLTLDVSNSTFAETTASNANDGGAIYATNTLLGTNPSYSVTGSKFVGVEDTSIAGDGSAMYLDDIAMTVADSVFWYNYGTGDGCIYAAGSTSVAVVDSRFTGNTANSGGCINFAGTSSGTVRRCVFVNNTAQTGGVFNLEGSAALYAAESVFSGNVGNNYGGVVRTFQIATLQLVNCDISDSRAPYGGGVLYADLLSFANITNCDFYRNQAVSLDGLSFDGEGGALYARQNSELVVSDSLFVRNKASKGGGVYSTDNTQVTVDNCVFVENGAVSEGGGIHVDRNTEGTIRDVFGERNYAQSGGAVAVKGSAVVVIEDAEFVNHTGADIDDGTATIVDGGAILCRSLAFVNLTRVAAVNNSVSQVGGGVMVDSCVFFIDDCAFSDNTAAVYGGGVYGNSLLSMTNSTLSGNSALFGGAVYFIHRSGVPDNNWDTYNISYIPFDGNRFSSNTADGAGGALFFEATRPTYLDRIGASAATSPFCSTCNFTNNVAYGYGGDVATAAAQLNFSDYRLNGLFVGELDDHPGFDGIDGGLEITEEMQLALNLPPEAVDASEEWAFALYVFDYYNQLVEFAEGSVAARPMQIKVTVCEALEGEFEDGRRGSEDDPTANQCAGYYVDPQNKFLEVQGTVIGPTIVNVLSGRGAASGFFLRGSQVEYLYTILFSSVPESTVVSHAALLRSCNAGFYFLPSLTVFFECRKCPLGEFDLRGDIVAEYWGPTLNDQPANHHVCHVCPEGASCLGGTDIFALEDWWWDPDSNELEPERLPRFYRCIPGQCCYQRGGDRVDGRNCPLSVNNTHRCGPNRATKSRLCSECRDGYAEWNFRCIPCKEEDQSVALVIIPVIVLILFIAFVTYMGSSLTSEFRIFITYGQLVALVMGPYHKWIGMLHMFNMRIDIMSEWPPATTVEEGEDHTTCPADLTPFGKLRLRLFIPAVGLLIVTLGSIAFAIGVAVWKRRRAAVGLSTKRYKFSRLTDAFINLFEFAEIPVLEAAFQLTICRQIVVDKFPDDPTNNTGEEILVLRDAPSIVCYEGVHVTWAVVALVLLVTYTMLLPSVVFYRRYRSNKLLKRTTFWHKEDTKYEKKQFKVEFYWWEVVVVYRSAAIVLCYVLFFDEPTARSLAMVLLCLVGGAVHALIMPYKNDFDNAMEALGWVLLCYSSYLVNYAERRTVSADYDDTLRDLAIVFGMVSMTLYVSVYGVAKVSRRIVFPFVGVSPENIDVGDE